MADTATFSCNLALGQGFFYVSEPNVKVVLRYKCLMDFFEDNNLKGDFPLMREERPIIALDFPSFDDVKDFLEHFPEDEKLYVKIGMEFFYAIGPEIVHYLKGLGHSIFLDLKLHDIPNTVRSAMSVLGTFGIDMVTVHAAGGVEMMSEAKKVLGDKAKLVAVTQLTSTSEEDMRDCQNIQTTLQESVVNYARKAKEAGLDGVVCSAQEVELIKAATANDFLCVTPGIRPAGSEIGDQKRVMTPQEAHQIGSDYIVVGRPIIQAENPWDAYHEIKKQWNS